MEPLYDITGHPLLSSKFSALASDDLKNAHILQAQLLLQLREPVYTGDEAEQLGYALVRQVNFQLEKGITPEFMKSVSKGVPGNVETFRDRYVDSGAWAIVSHVTKVEQVRFSVPGRGT
jgi:hypothetical protein